MFGWIYKFRRKIPKMGTKTVKGKTSHIQRKVQDFGFFSQKERERVRRNMLDLCKNIAV